MHRSLESIVVWFFAAVLAWAPFPLGSNRQWSAALLICLIAFAYGAWILIADNVQQSAWRYVKRLAVPFVLVVLTLSWAVAQTLPFVPHEWIHPIWSMASESLGQSLAGAVSLDPWRTTFEVMKIAAFALAFFLVVLLGAEERRASFLLDVDIVAGTVYAAYGIGLAAFGMRQFELFYSTAPVGSRFAGPFVLKNSYATFAGLAAVAAVARLFSLAGGRMRRGQGGRVYALSLLNFLSGRGLIYLLALILCFSTIVFSASRAGAAAVVFAFFVLLVLAAPLAARRGQGMLATSGATVIVAILIGMYFASGDTLQRQLDLLVEAGGPDSIRIVAWDAATRMIHNAPVFGLGLGTFETAFPLYASETIPFVLDKAHNDWLEFAAGLGLPAAGAWWAALAWLTVICIRGVYVRHRHRVYSAVAVGASALVAFHSVFDFSLQIPAVSLTYATLLGLGVAQAFPTRSWRSLARPA
ncbi:MAG: O-antigen ligase family protein [Alphaproteobacteria bacterium]